MSEEYGAEVDDHDWAELLPGFAELPAEDRAAFKSLARACGQSIATEQCREALRELAALSIRRVRSLDELSRRLREQADRQTEIALHNDGLARSLAESQDKIRSLEAHLERIVGG